MKFIHIADVHLGVKPDRGRSWSNDRADEIYDSFKNIIDICVEESADMLLIAGDLFHMTPTEKDLKNLDFQFRKLTNTKVFIIAGNHDYIEEGSAWETYEFQSDVVVFPKDKAAKVYIEELNVCITGYSYGRKEYTERILEKLKPGKEDAYNILLGHGGDKTHMPFSKERLARAGFNYVALGHIHKPAHILKNRMAFVGSLEPIDYTETGRRGYILGEVNEQGATKISWIPSNKRSYVNMALDLEPGYTNGVISDIVEEQIKVVGAQNIYRIMLKGRVDNNLEINLSGLTRRYNINEIINRTQSDYDLDEILSGNENNLLGRFIMALSDEDSLESEEIRNKAMRYGIEALLGAGDK
ncbi:MAG: DNA repair exonuclease [Lachnospiraceae bacterium]|nr:DNA repair exonuclease [Lachnospiraceae bacterium]